MRIRRFALVAVVAVALVGVGLAPGARPAEAAPVPWKSATETYYRLDTDNGRMSVRVEGEWANTASGELSKVLLYVMPGAENVVVKADGVVLDAPVTPGDEATAQAGYATVTLPKPLKTNLRVNLEATYDVPSRTGGALMTLEPGLVETPFIGQGPGSFVLLDVPQKGDNYLDPGCLKGASQPGDVKADGLVRWVCGEVTLIAINGDDPDVTGRCAAMDDKCRQRGEVAVFSAYVQSVTDPAKLGKLEGDVAMTDGRNVHMSLKFFKRDQAWADKQWAVATGAFPKLETLFGFKYELDYVNLRQSHHIGNIGAAGIAFNRGGEVLLEVQPIGDDREVTIHELAHQWSLYRHYDSGFMVEGLAEYATQALAPEFGVTMRDWGWQSIPLNVPLSTWENDLNPVSSSYFYGRSASFWKAYEEAVGGREVMSRILARVDDEQSLWPLRPGWFLDHGEWESGRDLEQLFLDWVYNPDTAKSLLGQRREAHTLVKEMQARAATMGLSGMPSDIYDNLIAWVFDPVGGQVAKGNKVLDAYAEVIAASNAAGLGAPEGVNKYWGHKKIAETLTVVEDQRQAVIAISAATKELDAKPDDSVAKQKLAEAREKYAAGDYQGAKSAAAGGVTAAYNEVAAGKMIDIAKKKQDEFSPNFFGRIGLFFENPDGTLKAAEDAYAAGDGEKALKLSRQAYDTWDGATQRGIQRLAIVAGLMCGLTFLVWYILHRLEAPVSGRKPGQGHYLEESNERRGSWRDWENSQ